MFAELSENWDSYGGRALQQTAIGPVLKVLMRIHQSGRKARLVPLPDGGVGLRLSADACNLEIDIGANGGIEALLEREGFDDVAVGPAATMTDAEQLLDQFVAAS